MSLLEENCLDENILDILLRLMPKIQKSQIYQCHDVTTIGLKSGRAQYEKGQKVKKIRWVKEVEKIEKVREVEKAVGKIR